MVKQLERITGVVERVSDKDTGIKVSGALCNVSMYDTPTQMPKVGQRVNLTVDRTDRGIWIQSVEVLDIGQIHQVPLQTAARREPTTRRKADIRRVVGAQTRCSICRRQARREVIGRVGGPMAGIDRRTRHTEEGDQSD
jgi:bacterioferritin-associated ferredoxin